MSQGPLAGIRVLEIESIGPGPFCAMLLADLGANVLRVSRPSGRPRPANPVMDRGRAATVIVDLKDAEGKARILDLVEKADALIEGYRPGVMERLGVGPEACLAKNPRLVYGRMTGWGRTGPFANAAGHDINYIALTGALNSIGTASSGPVPPLNLVGDFGGGGLMLAFGIVCALLETKTSGRGQVVDAAMTDGASTLMAMMHGMRAAGLWSADPACNFLDGSAYFYRCYRCSDGGWMSVGSIETQFRQVFFEKLGLAAEADALTKARHTDRDVHARIEAIFASKTRAQWQAIFEGTDACVAPVLSMAEAPEHPHNKAWGTFRIIDGAAHPVPAPRFGRTVPPEPKAGHVERSELRGAWGLPPP